MSYRSLSGLLFIVICPLGFGVEPVIGIQEVSVDKLLNALNNEILNCSHLHEHTTYKDTESVDSLHKLPCIVSVANHMLKLLDSNHPAIGENVKAVLNRAVLHYQKTGQEDRELCFEIRQIDLIRGPKEWTVQTSCRNELTDRAKLDVCGELTRACLGGRKEDPHLIRVRYTFENVPNLTLSLTFKNGRISFANIALLSHRAGRAFYVHERYGAHDED